MRRIALACLLACTLTAHASNWTTVTGDAKSETVFTVFEVDAQSVTFREGVRQAWVRYTVSPQVKVDNYNPILYSSYLSFQLFECSYKEVAQSTVTYYSGRFGKDEVVYSRQAKRDEAKANMQPVIPGTMGEAVLQFVCAAKLNK